MDSSSPAEAERNAQVKTDVSRDFSDLIVEMEPPLLTIRINRPHVRNACRIRTLDELCDALALGASAEAVRAVILTGVGEEAFSAGADLKEFQSLPPSMSVNERMRGWWALIDTLRAMRKPVIAAVRGFAVGGGTEIALASHIVIASETARFGLPEILRGHIPGAAGTVLLPRQAGPGPALYHLMTGEDITAEAAVRMGIAAKVVPDAALESEARSLALHLSAQSAVALAALIEAVVSGRDLSVDDAIALERQLCARVRQSEDFWEGLSAFVEKRQPLYGRAPPPREEPE